MKLDLGAGHKHDPGFLRLDIAGQPDVFGDARALPFRDGVFSEIRAHHILEHLAAGEERIDTMNECHRVLEDGGTMEVEVPVFPFSQAIADPTHRSFFVSESFDYFCKGRGHDQHIDLYGISPWELKRKTRFGDGQIIQVEIEKCAS